MIELKIDPEFEHLIFPLTDAEFERLKENVLADGEVYEPICVWNGTIVDGHNRYKIVQEHPEIPYRTKEMNFVDKWEAFEWMYRKQLGRRNLTDEQKTYMIGKMYEARKHSHGNNAQRGDDGQYLKRQNDDLGGVPGKTSKIIAKELGIGQKTVERAEKFSKGIDVLKEESPEAAAKILKGGSGITKAEIIDVPKMDETEQEAFIERIVNPVPKVETNKEPKHEPPKYKIDDLIKEVSTSGENFPYWFSSFFDFGLFQR